jgi:hypothetical protein
MYLSRRAPPIAATLMKKRPHGRVRSRPPGWLGGHLLTPTRSSKAGVLVPLLTPSMSLPKMSPLLRRTPNAKSFGFLSVLRPLSSPLGWRETVKLHAGFGP